MRIIIDFYKRKQRELMFFYYCDSTGKTLTIPNFNFIQSNITQINLKIRSIDAFGLSLYEYIPSSKKFFTY